MFQLAKDEGELHQLYCRIKFKQLRNEGPFTKLTLVNPGYYGGFNCGGMSVDKKRNLLIVNDMHMPQIGWLMPQDQTEQAKEEAKKLGRGAGNRYTLCDSARCFQLALGHPLPRTFVA